MSSTGAAAAAGAARQAELLRQQEEEELTKYSDAELQGDWEFKILRSNLASFAKPEVLKQVCEEEARAGWVLLEKFDNQRLRFKRPSPRGLLTRDLISILIERNTEAPPAPSQGNRTLILGKTCD